MPVEFFLQHPYIKLKQSYYTKVLTEDQNYNEVLRPNRNNMSDEAFNSELAGGGRRGPTMLTPGWRTAQRNG
jgi:hypothetical protein